MTEEYTEEKYNKEEKNTFKTFYWILFGAIVIMIAAPILIHHFSGADDTTRGTFGDMYGMVNALFSGLATGGVILAILLQRLDLKIQRQELRNSIEQLELQREEMQLQRQEMQQSTAEIRAQKEILDRQNFEDKFFRLLEHYQFLLESSGSIKQDSSRTGKRFLKIITTQINDRVKDINISINDFLNLFIKEVTTYSIHYLFNFIVQIALFVDKSPQANSIEEKKFYLQTFKASLSNQELILLLYYVHTENGTKHNIDSILNYVDFFEEIDFELTINERDRLLRFCIDTFFIRFPHLKETYRKQNNK